MAKVATSASDARERAKARRVAMERDRVERDDRIDSATAAVIIAQSAIGSAHTEATAAKAAAKAAFEAAVAAADQVESTTVNAQESAIAVALQALAAEKLTVAQVAELTELPPAEVRRFSRKLAPR